MAASAADVEEFLTGPLVTWLSTCVKKPESLLVYESFFDGGPINEVLLQIDPEPSQPVPTITNLQGLSIVASRIKIFHCIIRNIKNIYQEELGQIVVSLPDCVTIGRAPASQQALEHLKLLLLLLLGCAVQGPTKEIFITRIKELPVETQHDIVECIKRVTDDQSMVLTHDWPDQKSERLYAHLRKLTRERDAIFQQWVADLGQELLPSSTAASVSSASTSALNTSFNEIESNHLAVELADWKARLRKQRQELEEKSELLTECREELDHANVLVQKLKAENSELLVEARKAKTYQDEADAMKEKAERVDKLETEIQKYRERLADTEFYRVRVTELREDNRVLLETREMLETQLAKARQRVDLVLELEAELLSCKQTINELTLERDAEREKKEELAEENFQLQQVAKTVMQESNTLNAGVLDSEGEDTNSADNSLSEQLSNNAQARALRLELENQKLQSTIESLKENSFHESSKKILDLEKDKKKLEIKLEQANENLERLKQQNNELEEMFRNSIQESRKLQSTLDANRIISERTSQDLNNERGKVEELEKNIDSLTKEKQRAQTLCDTIKKRADDTEKALTQLSEQLQSIQVMADNSKKFEKLNNELNEKVASFEKDVTSYQKEINKTKEILEVKERELDEKLVILEQQTKEIATLEHKVESLSTQVEKIQEYEHTSQELQSQSTVLQETISTLQNDLVAQKVNNEKYKTVFEKLGLEHEVLDHDVEGIMEKMFTSELIIEYAKAKLLTEVSTKTISIDEVEEWNKKCEKLTQDAIALHNQNEALQRENATMQVNISTMSSQINSLLTQQTALQLANSQLVAEKDELFKLNEEQKKMHDTLLLDQVTIRTIHEQLNSEYENLKLEEDSLKKTIRNMRIEVRTLKDANLSLEKKASQLEQENEQLKNQAKSLANLRTEHSRLKDDFRQLFTSNDRIKTEYRELKEESKELKAEIGRLRLSNTELQGDMNSKSDIVSTLSTNNAKLQERCEILYEMNQTLDADRRALMEHVSKLLTQYHSLLMHSLEDKQHYHLEEKIFNDKLNNLCRQKEKLEEKIMEHYRKLDNASTKKRGGGFGANFVRRVRKAGTDVINKIPRNRRSWHDDSQRMNQSQLILGAGSGESGGNDSDNSAEDQPPPPAPEPFKRSTTGSLHGQKPRDEIALRRSHRDVGSHRNSIANESLYSRDSSTAPLSLGSVGTRRTVYISEDEPSRTATPPPPLASSTAQNSPAVAPFLVYNKISTTIGADLTPRAGNPTPVAHPPLPTSTNNAEDSAADRNKKPAPENSKENAIWYEYGCV